MKAGIYKVGESELQVRGRFVRKACFRDEVWLENHPLTDSSAFVEEIRRARLPGDIFSFFLPVPINEQRYQFHVEWENMAAAPTTSFDQWWKELPQESRKNIRRAEKRGVVVRSVIFDDDLVRGISSIYDETPVRQGRRFWHYKKPFDQVKRENATYLDRSEWVGAYLGEELIGFIKFVKVNKIGSIMQILSKEAHTDKRTTNALIAKAIEVCALRGLTHFIYGQYIYGRKENSPMTEFKRRNGFVRFDYPKYYVPLTIRGRVAMSLGLHRDTLAIVPAPVVDLYLRVRGALFKHTLLRNRSRGGSGVGQISNISTVEA
jgi:hypothetical protein